jgi:hypothetical protein
VSAYYNIYSASLIFRALSNRLVNQGPANDLLVVELIMNITMFIGWVIAIIFAYRHKRLFPKLFLCLIAMTVLVNLLDIYFSVVNLGLPFEPNDWKSLMQPLIAFLIWGPYMYRSKRVKNTFTK